MTFMFRGALALVLLLSLISPAAAMDEPQAFQAIDLMSDEICAYEYIDDAAEGNARDDIARVEAVHMCDDGVYFRVTLHDDIIGSFHTVSIVMDWDNDMTTGCRGGEYVLSEDSIWETPDCQTATRLANIDIFFTPGSNTLTWAILPTGMPANRDVLHVYAQSHDSVGLRGSDFAPDEGTITLERTNTTPVPPSQVLPPPVGSDKVRHIVTPFTGSPGDAVWHSRNVSMTRFSEGAAAHVVLARVDVFADSLGGTALTADGPLLFTEKWVSERTTEEILRVLPAGGTVYILGGTEVFDEEAADWLTFLGYTPVRLAGAGRHETAVAVAEQVRHLNPDGNAIAVAVDNNFADSVTVGAWAAATGQPIVLTDGTDLSAATRTHLESNGYDTIHIIGGTAAVSDAVVDQIRSASPHSRVERIAGTARDVTAIEIAARLLPGTAGGYVINGYHDRGWVPGLVGAGLAADRNLAIVLTQYDRLPATTEAFLHGTGCATTSAATTRQLQESLHLAIDAAAGC